MKIIISLTLLLATLPCFAQDMAALTAETKKTVLTVVPKVVTAMQDAVAEKSVAGHLPVCQEQPPELSGERR